MSKADLPPTVQFQLFAPFNLQLENREGKWNEAIATLNSKAPFTITSDIKSLLRLGIPISQRVRFDLVIKHFWASDSIMAIIHSTSHYKFIFLGSCMEGNSRKKGNEMWQRKVPERLL